MVGTDFLDGARRLCETRLVGLYGKKQALVWQQKCTSNVDPNTMM